MIRTVHIINSMGVGGAERQLIRLCSSGLMGRFDHSIQPLVASRQTVESSGARIFAPLFSRWRSVRSMLRLMSARGHLVITAWMYHSWLIGLFLLLFRRHHRSLILYCRHGDIKSLKRRTFLLAYVCLLAARRLGVCVVFNSESARRSHVAVVSGLRTKVIANGIEVTDSPRRRQGGNHVAYVGRNHTDKGADRVAVLVARLLSECDSRIATIAGPGMAALRCDVELEMRRASIDMNRVKVLDCVPDVAALLEVVDVVLLPSRSESFPNILVEAIDCGALPACMAVGDVPLILGSIVEAAGSVECLAKIASCMLNMSADDRAALNAKLRTRVSDRFGLARIAKEHGRLWLKEISQDE